MSGYAGPWPVRDSEPKLGRPIRDRRHDSDPLRELLKAERGTKGVYPHWTNRARAATLDGRKHERHKRQ